MIRKASGYMALAILLFFLAGLAFIHTPMFASMVRHDLEQQIGQASGEPLHIGELDIRPFSGSITAHDIQFSDLASISFLHMDVNVPRLFLFRVIVEAAEVSGVRLNVRLSPDRKGFQTDPLAQIKRGFDTLILKKLLVRDLTIRIAGREDLDIRFDGPDFLLQAGFDGDAFRYTGTAAFANGQVTVNGQPYLLNMGCTFTIRKDAIDVRELTITRGSIRLALGFYMDHDLTRITLTGTVPLKELSAIPEIQETLATIDLAGDFQSLSGPVHVLDPHAELNGTMVLNLADGSYRITELTGTFRDHQVKLDADLTGGSAIQLKARVTGPLLSNFTADIDLVKDNQWRYDARITGRDCGGGHCDVHLVSGSRPELGDVNLELPFLKTGIRDNRGWAELSLDWIAGRLEGRFLQDVLFAGNVRLDRLTWEDMTVPPLTANMSVHSLDNMVLESATIYHEQGQVNATGWYRDKQLTVSASLQSFPLREGLFAVPEAQDLDISGLVTGNVEVTGSIDNPDVSGTVTLTALTLFDLPMDRGTSSFHYHDEVLELPDPLLENGMGTLRGSGIVRFDPDELDIRLSGERMQILYLPLDFLQLDEANGTVVVSGTTDHPLIQADMEFSSLTLEDIELGCGRLRFDMDGPDISVHTETDRRITANVTSNTSGATRVRLETADTPIQIDPAEVTASLSFDCSGNFNDLDSFTGEGVCRQLQLDLPESISLHAKNIELNLQGMFLQTEPFPITHPYLGLFLESGAVQLNTGELWTTLTGDLDATPFRKLILEETGLLVNGHGTLSVDFSGTLETPVFNGVLDVADGRVDVPGLTRPVTDLRGSVSFEPSMLTVQKASARYGNGTAVVNGLVSREAVSFSSSLEKIPLELPGITADVTGFARIQGKPDDQRLTLSANLTVDNALVYPEQAALSGGSDDMSALKHLRLDLSLLTRKVRIIGPAMTLYGSPSSLVLTGPAENPILLGTQQLSPESTILINDIPLRVQTGALRFENHFEINPSVDITAATNIQGYLVRCRMRGSEERIQLNLTSSPPLKEKELMALLFGSGGISAGNEAFAYVDRGADDLTGAGVAIALNNLIAPLQRKVKNRLGVERFTITPQMFDARSTPSPIVTFEKDLSSRLTGTWSQTLVGSGENLVQLKYDMYGGRRSVVARKEIDGSVTLELEFQRR